ncbi:LOW QUALITY PROTEIN: dynactin subunit 2-like [Liolophura sinensis]|uniref:LOW QUALITY PROTEIN: dynactin subunit 2-like n=1 Tax=Liolophura sinensis TaxID=3198878 RepID=UPI003159514D
MAADPKYANLPGIDLNSPDVYETGDLPEDDQNDVNEELNNENVEKLSVDVKSAYSKFKGKDVSAGAVDFSDSISKGRRTGYDVHKTEYELAEDGARMETPQQKYQRLLHEIRELAEETNKIQEAVKDESSSDKASPIVASKQLDYLQHQLADLHLEKLLGPEASIDLSDPQGALQKRLLTQLESVKAMSATDSSKKPSAGEQGHVKYELFYKPEQAQFSRSARVASLEERLERLEAVIGQNTEKLGVLTADTNHKSLLGAVTVLNSKLNLLDGAQLEQVDGRLSTVLNKLDKVGEKAGAEEDVEKQTRVAELYELVKKWETMSDTVPHLVDRLVSLKDLHEQALQFSQSLAYLDSAQEKISSSLSSHGDMLKKLQALFQSNTEMIKTNSKSIETRIQGLKKK